MAVPLQIQSSVGGLPVYCCIETAIMHGYNQDIQEGHGTICPGIFTRELNALAYRINMIQKAAFVC